MVKLLPTANRWANSGTANVRALASRSFIAITLGIFVGCGTEAPTVPICDGSDGLTLRLFYAARPDREVTGGGVRVENGHPSFGVDGRCRYFISGGWWGNAGLDQGWRQGELDGEVRNRLERLTASDLSDDCGSEIDFDRPHFVVSTTRTTAACDSGLRGAMRSISDMLTQRSEQLWTQARPLDQDLRVIAWAGAGDAPRRYAWPAELNLRDYYEADADVLALDPVGRSKRIPAAEAAPLRALREKFLRDNTMGFNPTADEGIPVVDDELEARVFMRDALPYEDTNGLWPIPGQ